MKKINDIYLQCMECCKWIGLVVRPNPVEVSLEEAVQMYKWRGCEIKHIAEDSIHLLVPSICKNLTSFGCKIYHTRPAWCRRYDGRTDPSMADKCLLLP